MDRRGFLGTGIAAGAALMVAPGAAALAGAGVRIHDVTTAIDLSRQPPGTEVWLPLFASSPGYQRVLATTWQGSASVRELRDPVGGAPMLHARWERSAPERTLTLVQRVATWDYRQGGGALDAAERAFWLRSSPGVPTGGVVRDTARAIIAGRSEPAQRLRAIYEWVIDHTWRDAAVEGCGDGDLETMLREGRLGGKCADINGLMVGLARAAGLPAREVYGIRIAPSARFASLGKAGGTVTGAQHCRAEVWLDWTGWFAVDPADVRKVVLEEKLPVDSAPVRDLAERLFGGWEGNWAAYNTVDGVRFPGMQAKPPYHFLMYPTAVCAGAAADCLDAASFAYRITSREVTA